MEDYGFLKSYKTYNLKEKSFTVISQEIIDDGSVNYIGRTAKYDNSGKVIETSRNSLNNITQQDFENITKQFNQQQIK